jgi:hypothetical protein
MDEITKGQSGWTPLTLAGWASPISIDPYERRLDGTIPANRGAAFRVPSP